MHRVSLTNRVALLAVVAVLVTGILVQWLTFSQMASGLTKEQQQLLQSKTLNLQQAMDSYRDDAQLLASLGDVKRWLAQSPRAPAPASLVDTFAELMEHTPDYFQVRLLDGSGQELLKVERQDNGRIHQVTDALLQDKSDRDYMINSQGLAPGELYISPMNLNQEFGRIQIPHLPTVRLLAPVVDDTGKRLGFTALNVDFRYDLNSYLVDDRNESYTYLLNEKGQILFSPQPNESFAFELGQDLRLQDKFPSLMHSAFKLTEDDRLDLLSNMVHQDGRYFFISPVYYTANGEGRYWFVVRALPQHFLLADALKFRNIFLLQLLALVVLMFLLLTFGIRRLLYPLRLLGQATYQVARGNYGAALPAANSKELRRLTDDFTHMLNRLKDREIELTQNKDRFALFLSKVPCEVAIFDMGMRYVAASDQWIASHSLDALHYKGRNHYDVFESESEEWRSIHARSLRGESQKRDSDSFMVGDRVQWLRWEVVPWYDGSDRQGGIIVFQENITERVALEADKQESEQLLRATFDNAPEGIALVDTELKWQRVNRWLAKVLGNKPAALEGKSVVAMVSHDSRDRLRAALMSLKEGGVKHRQIDLCFEFELDDDLLLEAHIAAVRGRGGQLRHYVFQMRDVTVIRLLQQQQQSVSERLDMATKAGRIGIWEYQVETAELHWDELMYSLYQLEPENDKELLSRWRARVHHDDLPDLQKRFDDTLKLGLPLDSQFRVQLDDGELRFIRTMAQAIRDEQGRVVRVVGCNWDVSEFKLAEQALAEEKERLNVTLGAIGDAVLCTDAQGHITYLNHVAEELLAWSSGEAMGRNAELVFTLYDEHSDQLLDNPIHRCLSLNSLQHPAQDVVMVNRRGKRFDILSSVAPVRSPQGAVTGTVMVFQDMTRTKSLQRELSHAAAHDALTDLLNRAQFEQCVEHCIDRVQRSGKSAQLCFFDLDSFKVLNDSAGHSAGDALLIELGQLWRSLIRSEEDTLARLGGDEFGLLLEHCSQEKAKQIAEQMLDEARKLNFRWEGQDYDVTACVGIASITPGTQSLAEVMSHADVACYAAKASGRARVCIYSGDDMAQMSHQELMMASRLKAAISQQRFLLYSQLIQPFDGEERMVELLLRLRSDDGGIIGPGAFIPAAERYDLMEQLDLWVLEQVLVKQGPSLAEAPIDCFFVNLSANSLGSERFAHHLLEWLNNSPLAAHRICFEITETALINQMSNAIRLVQQIRSIGAKVAIDDFGSGLSSFAYLRHFQVDFIKIDGCFVQNAVQNPLDRTIISSVSNIAHRMQAKSIAEWVEDDVTANLMHKLGLDYAQGYFFSHPQPLAQLLAQEGKAERPAPQYGKSGGLN